MLSKKSSWIDNLPDDEIQVGMLKFLSNRQPGSVSVIDLADSVRVGNALGAKTLKKMVRYGQINVENDGMVTITGFGKKSIGAE